MSTTEGEESTTMSPPPTTTQPMDKDVSPSNTIITSLSLYVPLFLFAIFLFEILRNRLDMTYTPRKRNESVMSTLVERSYGFFGWILPVIRTSDQEILEQCGLDSVCFLRFLRMGQKFAGLGIVMSWVLFPVYATGTHPMNETRADIDPLEEITMSNINKHEQIRIWCSVLAMYIMTLFAMWLFLAEFKIFAKLRHQFLSQPGPQQYTIVINDLPRKLRSNTALAEYMDTLFPGLVHSVHVAVECSRLEEKISTRVDVRNALEHALAVYKSSGRRPTHRKLKPNACESVDSIQFYQNELDKLNIWISEEITSIGSQRQGLTEPGQDTGSPAHGVPAPPLELEPCDTIDGTEEIVIDVSASEGRAGDHKPVRMRRSAFVSLRTLKSAQVAQQLLQTEDPIVMGVLPAPHPRDIVWENIGTPWRQRQIWQIVSWTLTIFIILFWTFPTAFVMSLATVETLSANIPYMSDLFAQFPFLTEFVKQLAPILLIVMTLVAAAIFGALSRREGHPSLTQVNASFFSKLVYFQVFQIFFISVVAGTFFESFESIKKLLNEPAGIVAILGTKIPAQSTAFMAYLIAQTGLKLSLELLRVVPLIMGLIFRTGAPNLTKREKEATLWLGIFKPTSEPGEFLQAERLPNYYLAVLLIFAFCAIAPLLSYVAGAFLLLSDIVYRRQFLFVYDPSIQSTGVFWPKLHDCLVGALLIAQLTLLGLLSVKLSPGPVTAATVLPFISIAYYVYVNSLWPRTVKNLPLNLCAKADAEIHVGEGKDIFSSFTDDCYTQPALLEGKPLLAEDDFDEKDEPGSVSGLVDVKVLASPTRGVDGAGDNSAGDVMLQNRAGEFGIKTQDSSTA